VQGATTPADLDLVHVWNEMAQIRSDAIDYDVQSARAVGTHLAGICLRLRPRQG